MKIELLEKCKIKKIKNKCNGVNYAGRIKTSGCTLQFIHNCQVLKVSFFFTHSRIREDTDAGSIDLYQTPGENRRKERSSGLVKLTATIFLPGRAKCSDNANNSSTGVRIGKYVSVCCVRVLCTCIASENLKRIIPTCGTHKRYLS